MSASAAIQLLDIVWANANTATSHSWERLNTSMKKGLNLAIGAGFEFDEADMKKLAYYRSHYWIGESDEWIYSAAISVGNMSAIKSFEHMKDRPPFIADDVSLASEGYSHGGGRRNRERLCVGAWFSYRGRRLKVTSFANDGSYLNACSYKWVTERGYDRQKVEKRFKITPKDIQKERAERKERA